jgi:hypothetical protein
MGKEITVGLVGCASQKLRRPVPARELYVSQLFKKASAYAEATCDRWYVLSAMHELPGHENDRHTSLVTGQNPA